MGYNDKYPDMSAMYAVQFEYENKLKDKIKELEAELERTRKALYLAFEMLKDIKNDPDTNDELTQEIADRLDEITALEKSELENLEMLVNNVFK